MHGVLLGYRVLNRIYSEADASYVNRTTVKQTMELKGLKKFTNYSVMVLAYTRIGDGKASLAVTVSTDEDGKTSTRLTFINLRYKRMNK